MVSFRTFRPLRTMRPLDLFRAVNPLRTLESRAVELRPILMMLYVGLALVFRLVLVVLVLMLSVFPVVPVVVIVTIMPGMFMVMLVVMLVARVSVTFHVAHFHAELVRHLAPSHAARAQLQHAGKADPLSGF